MNYYTEIKNKLINNEIYARVKDYSKERNRLLTYYEVGKLLSEAGKHYGEGIIKDYSQKLTMELGKGYSKRNLWLMLRFYIVSQKVQTMSAQLTWSHYVEIISIKELEEIVYYINITQDLKLSVRNLRERIKNKEYERLPKEAKKKRITNEKTSVEELIKNPIIIRNNNNYEVISEKVLQKLILEDIESFMKELGNSFCFIGSEYKIRIGNTYNYIDLLLFNYEFNCFVVIELKVTKLKKEHIGQIHIYMNYIDNNIKKKFHDKTIGIIVCKKNNQFILEYCSDKRIMSREFKIML